LNETATSMCLWEDIFTAQAKENGMEDVFTKIYKHNLWGSLESRSGPGSSFAETQHIGPQLLRIIKQYNITSLLDAPCGDFNWMSKLYASLQCDYTGGDIVPEIVANNQIIHPEVKFEVIDITVSIPRADLVMVRDCLVHFTYEQITTALAVINNSGSQYLLTTHFPLCKQNHNLEQTGHWRPLNMTLAPFNFQQPLELIQEGFYGKTMGLWKL